MVALIRFAAARHMWFVQMNNPRAAVILSRNQEFANRYTGRFGSLVTDKPFLQTVSTYFSQLLIDPIVSHRRYTSGLFDEPESSLQSSCFLKNMKD